MKAAVSLIIPTYNSANYLSDSLASALNQNNRGFFEIIVVDDGSSDSPEKVVEEIGGDVLLVRHGKNKGISEARNTGVSAASGDFVAFLDADDVLSPDYLEKMTDFLRTQRLSCGGCWLYYMSRLGTKGSVIRTFPLINQKPDRPGTFPSGFIIERKLFHTIGGFSHALTVSEDTEFFWRMFAMGFPVYHLPEALVGYRINVASLTTTGKEKKLLFMDLLRLNHEGKVKIPLEQFDEIYSCRLHQRDCSGKWVNDRGFQEVYRKVYPWKELTALRGMYALWLDREYGKFFVKAILFSVKYPGYLVRILGNFRRVRRSS